MLRKPSTFVKVAQEQLRFEDGAGHKREEKITTYHLSASVQPTRPVQTLRLFYHSTVFCSPVMGRPGLEKPAMTGIMGVRHQCERQHRTGKPCLPSKPRPAQSSSAHNRPSIHSMSTRLCYPHLQRLLQIAVASRCSRQKQFVHNTIRMQQEDWTRRFVIVGSFNDSRSGCE